MLKPRTKPHPLSTSENALWNASGCLFYLGCQWVTTVLVVLLSKDYGNPGVLAFAMSIGNMFASIGLFKVRTYQVSDINNQFTSSNYIGFRIVTILISFVINGAYLLLISNNATVVITTFVFLFFKADETFSDVLYGIEQKSRRMDYIGKSQFLRGGATLIGFFLPMYVTGELLPAIGGMATLCVLITVLFDVPHARRFGPISSHIQKAQVASLTKACLLPTVANLCAVSIVSVARQAYGITQGEELLGIYASVATPAVLIQAGAAYLYSPLIGSLASKLINNGRKAFRQLFLKVLAMLICCMSLIIFVLSLFGGALLSFVYGPGISSYVWIFPYVLAATAAIALLLYVNDVLLILRDGVTQIVINSAALALVVLLSHFLITRLGMNGVNLVIIIACVPALLLGIAAILFRRQNPSSREAGTDKS